MPQGLAYHLTIHIEFAEDVVPASFPVLIHVPDNATKIYATGVPFDYHVVTSHYRIFRPDDSEMGSFALDSNEKVHAVDVEKGGDYVVYADHTENGFLRIGLDVPPVDDKIVLLRATLTRDVDFDVSADQQTTLTKQFELKRMPLEMFAWVEPPAQGPGQGHNVRITITNGHGTVLQESLASFVDADVAGQGQLWSGLPDPQATWSFNIDHHAYAPGPHTIVVKADTLRGVVVHYMKVYLRPGESAPANAIPTGGDAATSSSRALAPVPSDALRLV
jgi:hypothetical protein